MINSNLGDDVTRLVITSECTTYLYLLVRMQILACCDYVMWMSVSMIVVVRM
jgi:hypothetical protein